jgi:hypothetical protein
MTEDLDGLLAQKLADMPDNGFSGRVAARVELQQLRRARFLTEVYIGLVLLAVLVLPFTPIGAAVAAAAFTPGGMALAGLIIGTALLVFHLQGKQTAHRSLCL